MEAERKNDNKASTLLAMRPRDIQFEVHQYDAWDREVAVFYSEEDIYNSPNYLHYYYRIAPFIGNSRKKVKNEHFGTVISNTGSNFFDLGDYWNGLINDLIPICNADDLLEVFTGNLRFHYRKFRHLSTLNHDDFNQELIGFTKDRSSFFTEIESLWEVNNRKGLYILVLDDYACCYIGQSKNIKTRIQQHWSRFWTGTDGIDMFKALDTTRIFACCVDNSVNQGLIDKIEYLFIHSIDRKYLLNNLGGGMSLEFIHSDGPLGYGSDPIY